MKSQDTWPTFPDHQSIIRYPSMYMPCICHVHHTQLPSPLIKFRTWFPKLLPSSESIKYLKPYKTLTCNLSFEVFLRFIKTSWLPRYISIHNPIQYIDLVSHHNYFTIMHNKNGNSRDTSLAMLYHSLHYGLNHILLLSWFAHTMCTLKVSTVPAHKLKTLDTWCWQQSQLYNHWILLEVSVLTQ